MTSLRESLTQDAENYRSGSPYPHIVLEDFVDEGTANALIDAFPAVGGSDWIHYIHVNEKKHGLNKWEALPPAIADMLRHFNSDEFVAYLSELTGIPNLKADEMLEGGGLHQSVRGGFLNIHADFLAHPHKPRWRRRVNVLLYLNKDWKPEYNGQLELWSGDMQTCEAKISPDFNRVVVFSTDQKSFHGFPDAMECPEGMTRKSIALYYFTEEDKPLRLRTTDYRARPGSGIKALWIWLDVKALYIYGWIKRTFGIDDKLVSKILGMFRGKKH